MVCLERGSGFHSSRWTPTAAKRLKVRQRCRKRCNSNNNKTPPCERRFPNSSTTFVTSSWLIVYPCRGSTALVRAVSSRASSTLIRPTERYNQMRRGGYAQLSLNALILPRMFRFHHINRSNLPARFPLSDETVVRCEPIRTRQQVTQAP